MKFGDYFKNLIQTVLGGIPFQEKDVGKSIEEIDERLNKTSYGNLFEMMVNLTNEKKMKDKNDKDAPLNLKDLVDVHDDYQDEIYDLFKRRQRYNAYRDIVKKISRLRRTIKVLRSNIISSDNLRNTLLHYRATVKGDFEKEIAEVQERFKHLKINNHATLSRIIDGTLHYGDYFVEVVTKKNLLKHFETKEKLMESGYLKCNDSNVEDFDFREGDKIVSKKIGIRCTLERNGFASSILESNVLGVDKKEEEDEITLDDIQIFYHRPHNVIKLTLGEQVYGYLIIPENIMKTKMIFQNVNMLKTTDSVSQDFSGQVGLDLLFSQKSMERSTKIIRNILEFLKKNIHEDIVTENPALKSVITKLVYSGVFSVGNMDQFSGLMDEVDTIKISNLALRFVDVSRMQEFCLNKDEYDPYGTSIFDDVLFDSKLLISDKITATIERITKSIERRMVSFESDDRNSMSMIQILKEKFRKKKALFDGSTTFDNIPSILSPFEEYYIPMKGGQPYISFSSETPTTQHNARVDDLKFLRDEITSSMNVPPAYVGLEENIESKATLFLQNILFSIEILDHQEMFSNNLTELSDKIARVLNSEHIGLVKVGFALPVILSSASELEHISTVSGVKDYLIEIGLTNNDVRERYMPFLNEYFTNQSKTARKLKELEHGREGKNEDEGGPGF